jgi:hypothetical protein
MDHKTFYLASDIEYTLDCFRTYVAFIERHWNNIPGRPTVVFLITKEIYRNLIVKKSIKSKPK